MPRNSWVFSAAAVIIILAGAGSSLRAGEGPEKLIDHARQTFSSLPDDVATPEYPVSAERVELGRELFFDPQMSTDGAVSCSRCHLSALYGTDGLAKPLGAHGRVNPRNAPTVLNTALQFKAHWRGDRANVEDQAKQALIGPPSFGNPSYAAAVA